MVKKETLIFGTILLFLLTISLSSAFWPFNNLKSEITGNVVSSSQCTVSSGVQTFLDTDFNQEGNTARTLVSGDAVGTFTENTYIMIDCNVNNVLPAPLEKNVKARLTYSSTTLAYRGYCHYPKPEVETRYDIGATLYPNNQACISASEKGHVNVQGFGKPPENVTKQECGVVGAWECIEGAKCKSPAVSDGYGKCSSCPPKTKYRDGKCISTEEQKEVATKPNPYEKPICPADMKWNNGECTSIIQEGTKAYGETNLKENDSIPNLPEDEDIFELKLEKGWNLIGLPFTKSIFVSTTCDSSGNYKSYTYNSEEKKYKKVPVSELLKGLKKFEGQGIWFKSYSECVIKFRGDYSDSQSIQLFSGWNLISVQNNEFKDTNKFGEECKLSAIWNYDASAKKYLKSKSFEAGKGYWVKSKENCILTANGEDTPPSAPQN